MGLGKLEEVFDFIRSQLKRRQEGVMTHIAPPGLVGKRLHRTGFPLYNASAHAIYSSEAGMNLRPPVLRIPHDVLAIRYKCTPLFE